MAQDEPTRTPTAQDGDAGVNTPTADPTPTDERPASPGDEKTQKDILANKLKAEALNALMAEHGVSTVQELRERLAQPPAAREPSASTRSAPDPTSRRAELRQKIAAGEANASDLAELLELQEQAIDGLSQGTADGFVLSEITDKKLRERAVRHYSRNRHRLGDLQAAINEIKAADLETENATLREQIKSLNKKPDPDVTEAPSTLGREMTTTQLTKKKMRRDEFRAKVAALEEAGDFMGARKLRHQYADDKIEVT
jgi:hypothetical protein